MAMFARHSLTDYTLKALASVADNIAIGIERKLREYQRAQADGGRAPGERGALPHDN